MCYFRLSLIKKSVFLAGQSGEIIVNSAKVGSELISSLREALSIPGILDKLDDQALSIKSILDKLDDEEKHIIEIYRQKDEDYIDTKNNLDNSSFLEGIYQDFLLRESDLEGFNSQLNQLNMDVPRQIVLQALKTSDEARNIIVEKLGSKLEKSKFICIVYYIYEQYISKKSHEIILRDLLLPIVRFQ